jgi:hypothetical protein
MAYQTHLKLIWRAVWRVEMRAMLKNQKARAQMKLCGVLVRRMFVNSGESFG